jgi:hypothetical protein
MRLVEEQGGGRDLPCAREGQNWFLEVPFPLPVLRTVRKPVAWLAIVTGKFRDWKIVVQDLHPDQGGVLRPRGEGPGLAQGKYMLVEGSLSLNHSLTIM